MFIIMKAISFSVLRNEAVKQVDRTRIKAIKSFITPRNLVDKFNIKNICFYLNHTFGILQEDLDSFNKAIFEAFGISVKVSRSEEKMIEDFYVKKFEKGEELIKYFQQINMNPQIKNRGNDKRSTIRNLINYDYSKLNQSLFENKSIFCLDIEVQPHQGCQMTEFGFVFLKDGVPEFKHYLVQEFKGLKLDSKACPNYQNKYLFGKSEYVTMYKAKRILEYYMKLTDIFVAHSAYSENHYLRNIGISVADNVEMVLDTQVFHKALTNEINPVSLENMLNYLNIEHNYLHNSGNDASYTFFALMKMIENK